MYADPTDPEGWHSCHFCGTYVNKDGYEHSGKRHYLSDCRPDLVEHEIGETCTWYLYTEESAKKYGLEEVWPQEDTCYAYQDKDYKWTKEHTHFYKDRPM